MGKRLQVGVMTERFVCGTWKQGNLKPLSQGIKIQSAYWHFLQMEQPLRVEAEMGLFRHGIQKPENTKLPSFIRTD